MSSKKYFFNDAIDAQIRRIYEARLDKRDSPIPGLKQYAAKLHWPHWVLKKRARELGLARTKESLWSIQEVDLLERFAHLSDYRIHLKLKDAGFNRTTIAVHLKLKRLRLRKNIPYYTASSLAEAFGIDIHSITRWIRLGYLKAGRKGTDRTEDQGGDTWLIHEKEVKRFILNHPTEFSLRKVEQTWFLDIVTEGFKAA
jgi:hypothetical protein